MMFTSSSIKLFHLVQKLSRGTDGYKGSCAQMSVASHCIIFIHHYGAFIYMMCTEWMHYGEVTATCLHVMETTEWIWTMFGIVGLH